MALALALLVVGHAASAPELVASTTTPVVDTADAGVALGTYVDRGRVRDVRTRVGAAPAGFRAVTVAERESGRSYPAAIGANALVVVERGADTAALAGRHALTGVHPLFVDAGIFLVTDAGGDGLTLAARLAASGDAAIKEAMPDLALARRRADIEVPPDDPLLDGQWFYTKMAMVDAWAIEDGVPEVGIAVIDNGCDGLHPDLAAKLDPGYDFLDDDTDPTPPEEGGVVNNHGTACAGLVAASTDNGIGVAGMCPECRARCARFIPDDGTLIPVSLDVEVFQWVASTGVAVASNSWGFNNAIAVPGPLATAIAQAHDYGRGGLGVVIVFAAGNESRTIGDDELCATYGVLCVGAITNFDETTSFSNRGDALDLVAYTGTQTTDIAGAQGDNDTDYTNVFGGTSSACPVAAGAAGLIVSALPQLYASEVDELLIASLRPAFYASPDENGHDVDYGFGILDPPAALRLALGIEGDGGAVDTDGGAEPEPEPTGDDDELEDGCAGGCDAGSGLPLGVALVGMVVRRRRRRG